MTDFNNDKLNTLFNEFEEVATEEQYADFMWNYLDFVNIWDDNQTEWFCHDDDETYGSLQEIVNKYPDRYENLLIVSLEGFFEDPTAYGTQQ